MFESKPRAAVEKKESSTETDEGLGSSARHYGSGSLGSGSAGSVYLSDSQDWVVSPSCSPDDPPGPPDAISPLLAEETFRYMTYLALEPTSYSQSGSQSFSKVLSADRVEQMTKTYNDMEVVTQLLVERDRDLELAARIGQSLLQRNHLLQERNEALEEQLAQALDQVHQLQHELGKKDELLRMVASVTEESETDSSATTPLLQHQHPSLGGAAATAAAALSQLEVMRSKLQDLEEENLTLRSEARQLKSDTISYEEKEQQLVSDCVKELRESNSQMVSLSDELSQKNEELLRHQEEIAQLLSQIVELQHRVKELALEKEELRIHLQASKDAQRQLTAELNELADRNVECVEMLQESQEEIRELRNKSTPSAGQRRHLSYGLYPMVRGRARNYLGGAHAAHHSPLLTLPLFNIFCAQDSLAAEIEGTMRRELSVEEESAFQDQRSSQKKVFQTVRSINASASRAAAATPAIPGSGQSSLVMTAQPFQSAQGEEVRLGRPGSPGGNDLTRALHRLTLRRQNFLCERQFFQAERERKLQALADDDGGCGSPTGSAASFSSFSNLSELSFASCSSSSAFKTFLPEKLQIVKPMEGSLTLHHWQQLAKPHLATILDPHPGVVTKGFCPLPQDAVYRLSDMEEDDQEEEEEGGGGVLEKGAAERGKDEKEEEKEDQREEEEGGITFKVRVSSTPDERRDRKRFSPAPPPPPPPPTPSTPSLLAENSSPSQDQSQALTTSTNTTTTTTTTSTSTSTSTTLATTTSSAPHPGKCQSSTSSTYTFTTCRILHPSDVTQVTPSSRSSLPANTPSSLRAGPSTPVTPCRLNLGLDSFPPRPLARPPLLLAKLVLERGISAAQAPPARPAPPTAPKPPLLLLPCTPPNSPSQSPSPSPSPAPPPHQHHQHHHHHPAAADNFLASRPAELFLQDVYGLNLGRAPHPDLPSPSSSRDATPALAANLAPGRARAESAGAVGLVERLRRLGFAKVLHGGGEAPPPTRRPDPHPSSATLLSASGGSLLDGLRRNQSLPAMIGGRAAARSVAHPSLAAPPPPHPTSLALPPPPWGDLGERRRQPASGLPSGSTKR
ncbi:trafficking kinesin-binding protein 2 isoform X2 [Nelusetta ayraudi]|uniref:trafficking kinesin-binding protein 2 isoform X2 n=1 Tax=Nelusetta ayraudi TaxID=303726 RepID=UPI003F702A92